MSSIIEAEEAKIILARKRIHDEKVKETRTRLNKAIRDGNDKELAEACRQMAGYLNPPSAHRKPKVVSPNPV